MPRTPEDIARESIDSMLESSGWIIQDAQKLNLSAGQGIAIREFPLGQGFGFADYLLYVDKKAIGVIEAKKVGEPLTGAEVQTEKYSLGLPSALPAWSRPLPFLYQSTGEETFFTNGADPIPASRGIFTFHRPENLLALISPPKAAAQGVKEPGTLYLPQTLLHRLQNMPPLITDGMRDCQIEAIQSLEKSLAANKRRALIQMQTGSGKTYMAAAQAYRLIKHGGARKILFLVDRGNLAKQTHDEFKQYRIPGDGRLFTDVYNVQWLQSNQIDSVAKVVITTIQRLYSILQGEEELDPEIEEAGALSAFAQFQKQPQPVVYNPKIPVETFDFVFTDECHRSIYNLWRQVLEYFDASLIGLTATPNKQTLGFFNKNLVMEYGHPRAVADKVNVDFDVYRIRTKITEQGSTVEAGLVVDKRDKKTRKVRWEELEEDLSYTPSQLDRAVVAVDQIRTIIRIFKDKFLPEVFPQRTWVPKTLIFAKDDSHADDIVRIIREEFGAGNHFCEKITYKAHTTKIVDPETGEVTFKNTNVKPEDLLSAFRNAPLPRIAVTVDMIATGTDIKPLEIVFFMRDVASANYFDQMKGRGCRTITPTEFTAVTPDAVNKSRYVIVDAVGVTERNKKDSIPPLEQNPTVPFKVVMQAVAQGATGEEVVSTLASRLSRLEKVISPARLKQIEEHAGRSLSSLIQKLVLSIDYDMISEDAESFGVDPDELGEVHREEALKAFHDPKLRELILSAQQDSEQVVDKVSIDEDAGSGISLDAKIKAQATIQSFKDYIEENKYELDALAFLYSRRRGKAPSLKQMKALAEAIQQPPRAWTTERLWQAYQTLDKDKVKGAGRQATDLVSLVRFALEQETLLQPFAETVHDRFARWMSEQQGAGAEFSEEQKTWLTMICDHIASSLEIEPDDFDLAPFVQQGGLGRAYQVFGDRLEVILQELNEVLVA